MVPAFDFHPDYDKQKSSCKGKEFVPDFSHQSKNSGYIILQDSKICVFYTNDLAQTPMKEPVYSFVKKSSSQKLDHAIKCVHGLGPMLRWTNENMLNRDILRVPSIIVAYNLFMNLVDIMDQLRATCATKRRERRVTMSLYTFILDLAINNVFALYRGWLWDNRKSLRKKYKVALMKDHSQIKAYREFKRQIAVALCGSKERTNMSEETIMSNNDITADHTIVKLGNDKQTNKRGMRDCKLCSLGETRLEHNGKGKK